MTRSSAALLILLAMVALYPVPGLANSDGEDSNILFGLNGEQLMYGVSGGAAVGVLAAVATGAPVLTAGAGILGTLFVAHLAVDALLVGTAALGSYFYLDNSEPATVAGAPTCADTSVFPSAAIAVAQRGPSRQTPPPFP